MHGCLRLPFTFSPEALKADLAMITQSDWIGHFVTANYEGDWSALALRIPSSSVGLHPVASLFSHWGSEGWEDSELLPKTPSFREVLDSFECHLTSVRLMRLAPGSHIKEHCDPGLDLESGTVRLHVPVQTNDDVDFRLNDERISLSEGECWYLRLSEPHSIRNNGQTDRIHLVIDAEVNPWLEALIRQADTPEGDPLSIQTNPTSL